jgi:MFS family permease
MPATISEVGRERAGAGMPGLGGARRTGGEMQSLRDAAADKRGIYYGWFVVASVATMLAITAGARFLFGVVLKPVSEEFGWPRADLAKAVTINVLLLSVLQPVIGILVDRFGSRPILLLGVVGTALMALPVTFATELWQIYLFYSVIAAFAFAATSPVNTTKLVAGWFTRRRSLALSIASSGGPIGQLLVIPVATLTMVNFGWRVSYWTLAGVAVLAMLPLGLWLVRDAPPGATDDPDATNADAGGRHAHHARGGRAMPGEAKVSLKQAVRSAPYWQLSFGFFVCGYTMAFTQVHMVPYILDMPEHSHSTMQTVASSALAVVGACSIAGSLLIGFLADRLGHKPMLAITYFLRGLAFLILLLAGPLVPGIFIAAIVLGISWTSTTPLTSAISADIYGRASLGTIFGFIFSAMNIGSAVGAFVAGLDFDLTGNYHLSLLANGFLGFAAAAMVQGVRVRSLVPKREAAPAVDDGRGGAVAAG